MSPETVAAKIYRALSIAQMNVESAAPVLYKLTDDSTAIGATEDNAIVLSGPSVAPRHLTIRRVEGRDYLLVDLAARWRYSDRTWHAFRAGDAYRCPRHGSFERLDHREWCPQCKRRRGSLWLMRPLNPGDTFDIGVFRATYRAEEHAAQLDWATIEPESMPPMPEMQEANTPTAPSTPLPPNESEIPIRALPTDDSNLWCWQPADVPFPVFMHQRVNVMITQHARQNRDREVGGVLLGDVCRAEDGQLYVVITHALQAAFASETRGHLTFTHKTWLDIHTTREADYPNKTIVGWYHTHPGWRIFLSEWDLFIHRNFFRQPWQVALVIDPSLDRAGFFVWKDAEVCNPQSPVEPFRLAELENRVSTARPRVRLMDAETQEVL